MKTSNEYKCAGNFFWADQAYSVTPGVPIRRAAVAELQNVRFKTARVSNNIELTIAVGPAYDPCKHQGSLQRVSADEEAHALILRVAQDLTSGCDEETLLTWRHTFLTTSFVFKKLQTDDEKRREGLQLRENIGATAQAVVRSPIQMVFELVAFRANRSKITKAKATNQAIVEFWDQIDQKSSERITKDYVQTAFYIWENLLKYPGCQKIILKVEDTTDMNKSPFDSPSKMEELIRAVQDFQGGEKMVWVLAGMADMLTNKMAEPGEFSRRNLTGKGAGGKGLAHLLVVKMEVAQWMAHEFAESIAIDQQTKGILRDMTKGFEEARAMLDNDKAWIGLLPESGQKCVRFIMTNVLSCTNNWVFMQGLKAGKTCGICWTRLR